MKRIAFCLEASTKEIIASIDQFLWTGNALTLIRDDDVETSGDDRRASVSKKTRPRRASIATSRKESVRSTKDIKQTQKIIEDTQQLDQARRHRRIAIIVLGTFIFLLAASVLVVVITLTHSSFLSPASDSKEHNCKSWNLKVWILIPNRRISNIFIRISRPLKREFIQSLFTNYDPPCPSSF